MAGHNKWAQIKHQKGVTDKKRGLIFSKILKAIAIAAREEPTPTPNTLGEGAGPRLRSLIERAKKLGVPNETIERAIQKTKDGVALEELTLEAYGPGGIAILIHSITDNHNRTVSEVKHLLSENEGKLAEQGSVRWAFDGDSPKFPQETTPQEKERVLKLVGALEDHDDVQKVITNLK